MRIPVVPIALRQIRLRRWGLPEAAGVELQQIKVPPVMHC